MKLRSYFWPQVILKTTSSFNHDIKIIDFFGARSLRVNGMTQSGSIVEDIFKKIIPLIFCHSRASGNLYKFMDSRVKPSGRMPFRLNPENDKKCNVLILGFGTGTFAKLIKQKYPLAKIIGIEIDKTIIDLGEKYFDTSKINNLKVINTDAIKFVEKNYDDTSSYHSEFDIIFVDLYKGEQIESKVETIDFLEKVKELLDINGVIIFNRLNFSSYKEKAQIFKITLEKLFSQVTQLKSYSNIIFLGKK